MVWETVWREQPHGNILYILERKLYRFLTIWYRLPSEMCLRAHKVKLLLRWKKKKTFHWRTLKAAADFIPSPFMCKQEKDWNWKAKKKKKNEKEKQILSVQCAQLLKVNETRCTLHTQVQRRMMRFNWFKEDDEKRSSTKNERRNEEMNRDLYPTSCWSFFFILLFHLFILFEASTSAFWALHF